jgi:hypothetical protein
MIRIQRSGGDDGRSPIPLRSTRLWLAAASAGAEKKQADDEGFRRIFLILVCIFSNSRLLFYGGIRIKIQKAILGNPVAETHKAH